MALKGNKLNNMFIKLLPGEASSRGRVHLNIPRKRQKQLHYKKKKHGKLEFRANKNIHQKRDWSHLTKRALIQAKFYQTNT